MSVGTWLRRALCAFAFAALALLLSPAAADGTPCEAPTISWDGGAGTSSWTDAANWTGNVLPTSTDDVCVASGSVTVSAGTATVHSVEVAGTLTISGGALNVTSTTASSYVTNLTISGGILGGAGTVQVPGALVWTAGSMNDAGTTVAAASGTASISGNNSLTLNATRSLDLRGTTTWSGASSVFAYPSVRVYNSGTLVLSGTGSLSDLSGNGADPLFVNTGTVTKSTAGTFTIAAPFDNDGTAAAPAGALTLSAGDGGNVGTGSYDGNLQFTAGSFTMSGATLSGPIISSSSSALVVNVSGTVTVPVGKSLTLAGSSATLAGTGTLDVLGTLTWSGAATMSGTGTTLVEPGGDLQVTGSNTQVLAADRVLDLRGTSTWSGTSSVFAYPSARLDNAGTLTLSGTGSLSDLSGTGADPLFRNTGTVSKTGTGTFTSSVPMDNDGTVTVASGATLTLSGGDGGNTTTGAFSGNVMFSARTFTLDGATLAGVSITSSSSALAVTVSGTVTVPVGKSLTLAGSSATLAGTGTLDVFGTLTWTNAATMSGSGTTLVEPGGDLQISGSNTQVLAADRTLDLRGTATMSGTANVFAYQSASVYNSGTLTLSGTGSLSDLSGTGADPLLRNTGTVSRTGTGTFTITVPTDNDAAMTVAAGATLALSGGDGGNTETGVFEGNVLFAAGAFTLNGATLSGPTISSSSSALVVTVNGTVTVPAARSLTLTGGSASVAGTGTLDVFGTLTWSGAATMGGTGTTVVEPGGDLQVTGSNTQVLAADRTLDLRGTATMSGTANVFAYPSARMYNSGALTLSGTGSMSDLSGAGADPLFRNTGTVSKTGTGTFTTNIPMDNDGTMTVASGATLALSGGDGDNTATGTYAGNVVFAAGTFTLNGATLSGPSVSSSSSAVVVNVSGTVTVPSGSSLNLAGSSASIAGTGILDVSGTLIWTGAATMSGTGTTLVEPGGDLQVTGSNTQVLAAGRVLDLRGTATMSGVASVFAYASTRILNSGAWTLSGSGSLSDLSGAGADPLLVNSGSITKTGTLTTTLAVPVDNDGNVTVTGGTLTVSAGDGGNTETGTYDGVLFSAGTYTLSGGSLAGTISSSSTTLVVNVAGTVTVPAGKGVTLTGGNASISGGGTLDVLGTLTWTNAATMSGTGTTRIEPGGDLQITGSNTQLLAVDRELDLRGSATMSGASAVQAYAATRIANSGTLTLSGSGGFFDLSSTGTDPLFVNTGTISKTGVSTVTLNVPVDNDGTIAVAAGGLTLSKGDGGSVETGVFDGNVQFVAGTFTLSGATVGGAAINSTSSTLLVNVEEIVTVPAGTSLVLTGGAASLGGAGSLDVAGSLTWTSGATMTGPGTTAIRAGAQLLMPGGTAIYLTGGRHLDNNGTVSWTGGGPVSASDGTVVHNGGTWTTAGDYSINDASLVTKPLFVNTGMLAKAAGTGTATIGGMLDNAGTLRVDAGTFQVVSKLVNYNTARSQLTGGTYVLTGSFRFPNTGVTTNAASIVLDGSSAAMANTSGTNALTGLTRITEDGTLTIRNGAALTTTVALSNSGTVAVGPSGTLAVGGTFGQGDGATALATSGTLAASGTGVTVGGGTFEGSGTVSGSLANTGGTVSPGSDSTPGTLAVTGTFTQGPAGRLRLDIMPAGNDVLAISGGVTYDGTFELATAAGHVPVIGTTYTFMQYASATGSFAGVEGTDLGNGTVYLLTPSATSVTGEVTSASTLSYGSVSVNGGAVSTGSTAVTLTLAVPSGSGVTGVRIGNDADPTGAFQPYATSVPWTLTSGDAVHTVHVQFRDAFGNQSAVVTDAIVLDTRAPIATITVPGSATGFATVAFDEAVGGVTAANVVLRLNGSATNLVATLTCFDASAATVTCSAGTVRTIRLQPTVPLLPTVTYAIVVAPAGAPSAVVDGSGNAVATTTATFAV